MIVAHRGASRDAPENTLPSFNLAWAREADAVEGDFRMTRDGHIVCIHDRDTRRVAGTSLVVAESTLAELRTLDVGAWRGEAFAGAVIPTLAEVFATIPDGRKIFIEVKCGPEIIPALKEEIVKSGLREDQVVVICFDQEVIRQLKEKAPGSPAFWLSTFERDKAGAVTPSAGTILDTLAAIRADGFSSSKDIFDESLIQAVIDAGYEYHVWTVDDVETAQHLLQCGVKSITTNVPGVMKKHFG